MHFSTDGRLWRLTSGCAGKCACTFFQLNFIKWSCHLHLYRCLQPGKLAEAFKYFVQGMGYSKYSWPSVLSVSSSNETGYQSKWAAVTFHIKIRIVYLLDWCVCDGDFLLTRVRAISFCAPLLLGFGVQPAKLKKGHASARSLFEPLAGGSRGFLSVLCSVWPPQVWVGEVWVLLASLKWHFEVRPVCFSSFLLRHPFIGDSEGANLKVVEAFQSAAVKLQF